jgi:hypothetical protein
MAGFFTFHVLFGIHDLRATRFPDHGTRIIRQVISVFCPS